LPERVAILEVKNVELERQLSDVEELKRQVAELQAGTLRMVAGADRAADSVHAAPIPAVPAPAAAVGKLPGDQATARIQSIADKMQSDLADPKEIRDLMAQVVAMGSPGMEAVKKAAADSTAGNLRVPAVLVMAYSKDTAYAAALKSLCADRDPQMRREALTALVKLGGGLALEDAKRLLSDPDETVAMAAGEAYRQLTEAASRPAQKAASKPSAPARKRAKSK
jgi:hypothetical protein